MDATMSLPQRWIVDSKSPSVNENVIDAYQVRTGTNLQYKNESGNTFWIADSISLLLNSLYKAEME